MNNDNPFDGLPKGHFGAIVADPPWTFATWSGKGKARSAENHYETMCVDHIAALPVADLAAEHCALFLWAVGPQLAEALDVVKAWGFKFKTIGFAWVKHDPYLLWADDATPFMGMGYWTRANAEICLLATRGFPRRQHADVRQAIISERREHSRKPPDIYKRVERLVAGPYLELFSREARLNWTTWGFEVGKFNEAAE